VFKDKLIQEQLNAMRIRLVELSGRPEIDFDDFDIKVVYYVPVDS